MTSGKPPLQTRPLTPKRDENEPREGGADMEQRKMHINSGGGNCDGIDARLQAQIGQKLKAMYDEVAQAPIPDKFLDLLEKLNSQEKSK